MKRRHPFHIEAIVVLPDHLHAVWQLPEGDSDFSTRWREIKKAVTRELRGTAESIWQPRFWEHWLRDEWDWRRHIDYIHYNPVKHGLASSPPRLALEFLSSGRGEGMVRSGLGEERTGGDQRDRARVTEESAVIA